MKGRSISLIFIVALFCLYTICSLLLGVLGANIYRESVAAGDKNYGIRTSVLYVCQKVRANDVAAAVRIETVNGADALVMTRDIAGHEYENWLFVADGWLTEALCPAGTEVFPASGQRVMELAALDFDISGGLVTVTATLDDSVFSTAVRIRTEAAA